MKMEHRAKKPGLSRTAVDMTSGAPLAVILQFALPLLLGNLFNQLYNVADTAIVGRTIGANALAAVGSTGNVVSCLFMLLSGLCTGAGVIVAQYWGAQEYQRLHRLLGTFFTLIVVLAVGFSALGVMIAAPVLRLLQVPEELLPDAVRYLRIVAGMLLGNALYCAASAVLRSIGDSRTPLAAMVVSSVTNIGMDLWFILGFGMGVDGAAWATVLSQCLSAAVCLTALLRRHAPFDFAAVRPCFDRADAAQLLHFGVPTALQSCMITLGGMMVQSIVNGFGSVTMAAYTSVLRIDSLAIQLVVSVAGALSVFTGQNIGLHQIGRVRTALRQTLAALTGACIVLAVVVFLLRRPLLSIFLDPAENAASIEQGAEYLTVIGFAYVIAAVMNSYLNVLRGAGDIVVSIAAGLAEMGARLLFAWLLTPHLGVWGIWLATPLSWGCGCIIPIARYYSGAWLKKALV